MPQPTAPTEMQWTMSIRKVPGVSQNRARLFGRLGIETIADLLRHLPVRYEHEAREGAVTSLADGRVGSARGMLVAVRWIAMPGRGRKGRFEARIEDSSGQLRLTWFNAGYLRNKLHPGLTIRVQGKVGLYDGGPQMTNPKWQLLDEPDMAPTWQERLRPIYPATDRLPSTVIEAVIAAVLPQALPLIRDPLPGELLEHHAMLPLADAFHLIHQPQDREQTAAARRRLAFNELLLLNVGIAMKRAYVRRRLVAPALRHNNAMDEHIQARFPFELTPGQRQVINEIAADLTDGRPMNRLLQGDVGSGKTVVALYALLMAVANRKQGALMAPTELLAEQHYLSITRMLTGSNVRLALLTGGRAAAGSAERSKVLDQIASGHADIIVGTHALLTESVRFGDLAVAVIDEQHRFGVVQRAAFRRVQHRTPGAERQTTGASTLGVQSDEPDERPCVPHHLIMTATPIPRTLSLTVFGDLDVSTIRDRPPGRTPIASRLVGPDQADKVYRYLAKRLDRGEQAYVVVPTIDSQGRETVRQLKSVHDHAKLLRHTYGPGVATIHGRLKPQTRVTIMEKFRRGDVKVLVATTVIEVGMDVPGATVMVIEHAERFGLASLHQLRGRVGRGTHGRRSLCVFIADPTTDEARQRMKAIASTTDGFKIAELDLRIRGMGDFFGTRQHGLQPLRVANLPDDMDLLQLARHDAAAMIKKDPDLRSDQHKSLRHVLLQQYGEALGLIDVG